MKSTNLLLIVWAAVFVYALSACTADKLPEPDQNQSLCDSVTVTYDAHVADMFSTNCTYSGCHDGNNLVGLNYADMDATRRDLVHDRIQNGSMPPSYATGPTSMSQGAIDTIACWKSGGYLEN